MLRFWSWSCVPACQLRIVACIRPADVYHTNLNYGSHQSLDFKNGIIVPSPSPFQTRVLVVESRYSELGFMGLFLWITVPSSQHRPNISVSCSSRSLERDCRKQVEKGEGWRWRWTYHMSIAFRSSTPSWDTDTSLPVAVTAPFYVYS